jgi:2OG-Fe(II) oxygenase superfamily/Glycosyl transferase family 2
MKKGIIPVVVFAYNRADLLRQLLESLKNDEIPLLYVFSDGAKNDVDKPKIQEVRSTINEIDWCEKIVIEQERNLGLGKSVLFGVSKVLSTHKAAIFFEDDLVCVKGTYKYLSTALTEYESSEKVMSVTGWTHPNILPSNLNEMPYFDGKAECWCWGTWARAWKGMEKSTLEIYNECYLNGVDVEKYGSDMPKMALEAEEKNLWAIRWWYFHLLKGGLCLRPPYSLVETTGWDGRGTTITPEMMEWKNPALRGCPSIPINYPIPTENINCPELWRSAIDKGDYDYSKKEKRKIEKVKDGVWIVPSLLTSIECDFLLLKAKENTFNKANNAEKYGRYNQETYVKNEGILNLIRSRFNSETQQSRDISFKLSNTTEILEFYFYREGDFIKTHSDAPSKISETLLSSHTLVIYLNDGFEGGETYFADGNLKVKAPKGGAVLFDQSLNHGGSIVSKGEKYILRLGTFITNLK